MQFQSYDFDVPVNLTTVSVNTASISRGNKTNFAVE